MNFDIKDKLAIVTGASKGLGRAIAIELANEGVRLILCARNLENLSKIRSELTNSEAHHIVDADLSTIEGRSKLIEYSSSIGHVNILINNVGGSNGIFDIMSPASEWVKVWDYNLGIAHELNRVFLPHMSKFAWGRVVHISTLAASNFNGAAPYTTAKCALNGYIKIISRQYAKYNVVITGVSPGIIDLPGRHFSNLRSSDPIAYNDYLKNHISSMRLADPSEIAAVVVFLCSNRAAYMSGSIISVDGGSF